MRVFGNSDPSLVVGSYYPFKCGTSVTLYLHNIESLEAV